MGLRDASASKKGGVENGWRHLKAIAIKNVHIFWEYFPKALPRSSSKRFPFIQVYSSRSPCENFIDFTQKIMRLLDYTFHRKIFLYKILFPRACIKRWLNLEKIHKENIANFASVYPHFVCVMIGPCVP